MPPPTARTSLLLELTADFSNEPLEDGMNHEAEQTLDRAISQADPDLPVC